MPDDSTPGPSRCARCGSVVTALADGRWACDVHGVVPALAAFVDPSHELAHEHVRNSSVPTWLPWPLPHDWVLSGFSRVDDGGHATLPGAPGDSGVRATVLACSGPNPTGGPADLLVITEEPGIGLGACYAGLSSTYPGPEVGHGPPHATASIGGHLTPLWWVSTAAPDRAVYAGEADGRWVWLVLHPASAGLLMVEPLSMVDLRELGREIDLLPLGGLSPWLDPRPGNR